MRSLRQRRDRARQVSGAERGPRRRRGARAAAAGSARRHRGLPAQHGRMAQDRTEPDQVRRRRRALQGRRELPAVGQHVLSDRLAPGDRDTRPVRLEVTAGRFPQNPDTSRSQARNRVGLGLETQRRILPTRAESRDRLSHSLGQVSGTALPRMVPGRGPATGPEIDGLQHPYSCWTQRFRCEFVGEKWLRHLRGPIRARPAGRHRSRRNLSRSVAHDRA